MTQRSKKYFLNKKWRSFICKISGPMDDYMLCQLKIQQLKRKAIPIGKDITNQIMASENEIYRLIS